MIKRLAILISGFALLIALALFFAPDGMGRVWGYAASHPLAGALALLSYVGAFFLRALSWRPVAFGVPLARLMSLLFAALFVNHAVPAKAGDVARMYGISRCNVPAGRAVSGVILTRVADFAGLLLVLALAWAIAGGTQLRQAALPAALVLLLAAGLWAFTRLRLPVAVSNPLLRRVINAVRTVRDSFRQTTPRQVTVVLLWATPAWVLEVPMVLFALAAVGVEVSFAQAAVATCFAVLVGGVPVTPGSLGTYEAGMVFALAAFGFPAGVAFAGAVASHALKFVFAMAASPFALYEGAAVTRAREQQKGGKEPDEAGIGV
jgi:uncharacterized protein (TIRG00374 family)